MEKLEESKKIVKGEKISRILEVTDLENKVVFKQSVENQRIATAYYLDLSRKTEEQILIAAAEHFAIRDVRKRHFENLSDSEMLDTFHKTFDVVLYEPSRVKKSDFQKARDNTLKLSKEDFLRLLTEEYGMNDEQAIVVYKKKFNVE